MERSRLTEKLDILLQEFGQLERIIVVLEGNRYTDTRDYTERMLDESYHNVWNGCVLRTTH